MRREKQRPHAPGSSPALPLLTSERTVVPGAHGTFVIGAGLISPSGGGWDWPSSRWTGQLAAAIGGRSFDEVAGGGGFSDGRPFSRRFSGHAAQEAGEGGGSCEDDGGESIGWLINSRINYGNANAGVFRAFMGMRAAVVSCGGSKFAVRRWRFGG